jgi:diaminopimelate decarboxylase
VPGGRLPASVRDLARRLADAGGPSADALPAYAWDLVGLRARARGIRAAMPAAVEVLYAAKANPEAAFLRTLAGPEGPLDGVEVASGGELAHVRAVVPGARTAFGGPGKTPLDLEAALRGGVDRIHVESPHELRVLAVVADRLGATADVLLRANPPRPAAAGEVPAGEVLAMGGGPSPFGMDEAGLAECLAVLGDAPWLRLRGLHAHLTSGLGAADMARLAGDVLRWAVGWAGRNRVRLDECNLGGGMGVDYRRPTAGFDWARYGAALARLATAHPDLTLRVEPGRAIAAYDGYYLTRVIDLKDSHGEAFAVLAGGTHHLRTPAAKGHDQPFVVLPVPMWPWSWPRPGVRDRAVTLVGRLCTPKDVLARNVPISQLRAGDLVVFTMAGAYGWNISHRDFLMHPPPAFHQLG